MDNQTSSSLERAVKSFHHPPTKDPRPLLPPGQLKIKVEDSTKIRQYPLSFLTLPMPNPSLSDIPSETAISRNPSPATQQPSSMSDQSPNDLEQTKARLEVYRHEMNLAKFAEGRLRSQRDQYKALRNEALQVKSLLEKQLAAMTAALQEQRKEDAEARANIVVEAEGLRESLFATESDRDTYLQSLEASRAEAEAIRQSWAREKELLDKVSLTLKHDLEASREETSGLRRSLADEDRERRDALERIQSELDGVRRERETLVHSSADELAASRKEVDNLRHSLDDTKARERETSEALLKVQQDSKDNVAALRTSLGKEKAGHKKTRKRITDAIDAKALLEEELKVSLVNADEQKEAVDQLQRELASDREEHVAALARLTEHLDLAQAQSEGISSYAHNIFQANLEASEALEAAQQDIEGREENHAITIALLRTSLLKEREWREKFEDVEENTQEIWEGSAAAEEPLGTQNDLTSLGFCGNKGWVDPNVAIDSLLRLLPHGPVFLTLINYFLDSTHYQ